jgi:hypothetical protein
VVVDGDRRVLVAGNELRWVLHHEGGMGSEEGPMEEEDDGRRWELTVRGLKRWWRFRLRVGNGGPVADYDRRSPEGDKGGGALLVGVEAVWRQKKGATTWLGPF